MIDKTKEPKEIYHYTTLQGLMGIMESKSLFASHIDYLNDRKESHFADDIIWDEVNKTYRDVFTALRESGNMPDPFDMDWLCDTETRNFFNVIRGSSSRLNPLFVTSFCRAKTTDEERHGLLSQWRAYGGDTGVALVFDRSELYKRFLLDREKYALPDLLFGDVIYGKDDLQYAEIEEEIKKAPKAIPTMIESAIFSLSGKKINFDTEKIPISDLYNYYIGIRPRLKHWAFREEEEYRLIVSVAKGALLTGESRTPKPVKYRQRGSYLVPHIEMGKGDENLPISRVIVGPASEMQRRVDSISLLLESSDCNAEVHASEIPLV